MAGGDDFGTCLKPWRKLMWCVGKLTQEYRARMYDLLDLYARPVRSNEPAICLDEKSKQVLKDSRAPLPMKPGSPVRRDYEYVRAGTCNLFVARRTEGRTAHRHHHRSSHQA